MEWVCHEFSSNVEWRRLWWILMCIVTLLETVYGTCSDPDPVDHSTGSPEGNAPGDSVHYTCVPGYRVDTLDGSFTTTISRTCEGTTWSGTTPICIGVTCVDPGDVVNAQKSVTTPINYQDVVTYTCDDGYRTAEDTRTTHLTCQADATWDKDPPACDRISCPPPEEIPYSTRTPGSQFVYEDIVNYTCSNGYERTDGDETLTCDDMGNWNGTWPLCEKVTCGDPGEVNNSARVRTGVKYQHTVTYTCFDGYYQDPDGGNLTRTCEETADWSGEPPRCLGTYCGVPLNIPLNSTQTPGPDVATYRYPESLTFTCDHGFYPDFSEGVDEISCTKAGSWFPSLLSCSPVHCQQHNQSVNANEDAGTFYFGMTKTFRCKVGTSLVSGNLSRDCLADGTFSGELPVCQMLSCPALPQNISNGQRQGSGEQYRDSVVFTCDPGFQVAGEVNMFSRTLICQSNAQWTGQVPTCEGLSCGSPNMGSHTEVVNSTGENYLDTIEVTCTGGYDLQSGQLNRTCQDDGTWSGDPPSCDPSYCGEPPSREHVKRLGNTFHYPARVFYQCAEGYRKTPGSVSGDYFACQKNKTWGGEGSGMPQCAPVKCYQPEVIRGAELLNDSDQEYFYGDRIGYSCEFGHNFSSAGGPLERTCSANKLWSGEKPLCERNSCGDPGEIPGTYKLGFSFKYKDTVNYTCKAGYRVKSGLSWSALHCEANGTWTGHSPQCERVICGDPGINEFSLRVVHGVRYEDWIEYTCDVGYRVQSAIYKIQCIEDGTWTHPVPQCISVEEFNATAKVNATKGPPAESPDSNLIGKISVILMSCEVGFLVILDLSTIWKDLSIGIRNVKHGMKRFKNWRQSKQSGENTARVSPLPLVEE